MNEEQADQMLELLRDIKYELENVNTNIMLYSDASTVVTAIEKLKAALRN